MKWKNFCPICAVVVIIWFIMLSWMWSGHEVDKILLAILMGASIGAIATKYGQNMIWKSLMVALGVPVAWFALKDQPGTAAIFLGLIILLYFNFKSLHKKGAQQSDRFKDCC